LGRFASGDAVKQLANPGTIQTEAGAVENMLGIDFVIEILVLPIIAPL
jgi:hypothetical protein